jgi:hypothetical protein
MNCFSLPLKLTATGEECIESPTKFVVERNTSRRLRKIRTAPFDAIRTEATLIYTYLLEWIA